MLPVTFNGEDVYLLPYQPNWVTPFVGSFVSLAAIDRSLGGRTQRTPQADTLRESLKFTLLVKDQASAAFRVALQRLGSQRILCPFWPSAHLHYTGAAVYLAPDGSVYTAPDGSVYMSGSGESPWMQTGIWLTFEPGLTTYEVHTTDAPTGFTPSTSAVRVPLLLGFFKTDPDPTAITDTRITGPIEFIQSSPAEYALRPVTLPPVYGPAVAGRTPPLLDCLINWATRPTAGAAGIVVTRTNIGQSREFTVTDYPQEAERRLSATVLCRDWSRITALLSFFYARHGQVESFWLPGLLSECRLTAATSGSSAVISVDNAAGLGDNRYIAFTSPGSAPICRHVLSVDLGANTLTLDSSPGVLQPGQVNLVSLILGRFAKPELTLAWSTDSRATSRIDFVETPSEYYTPTGETVGSTIGGTPTETHLYRFTRAYPGFTVVNRYTSFERDLVFEGETYLARPITHDHAVETITLDDVAATVTSDSFTGNPLLMISPFRLEVPLYCEVIECTPLADGSAASGISRIYGKISKPSIEGQVIKAEIGSLLGGLAQNVPTLLLQTDCAVRLFSAPCGVAESAWAITGTVDSITSNVVALSALSRVAGGALPTITDGYFSYGRLWTGSGETYESRTIYNSAVASGGHVSLVLSHPLNLTPTAPLYFVPGCGGTFAECQDKFNNRARFRGFPYLPMANPSLVAIKTDPAPASKK